MIYFLFLFLASGCFAEEKYTLSVCAIFQNEAPYLQEWIEFHRLAGVEHFYLYNNRSEDHPEAILAPYVKKGIVSLVEWPHVGQDYAQHCAYNDCLARSSHKSKWVAFLDLDEFLFPVQEKDLKVFLARYEDPQIGGVCVNWQMYGSAFLDALPGKKLLIEALTLKAPREYEGNTHIKSIIRPERAVKSDTSHCFVYRKGFYAVDPDFKPCPGAHNPEIPIDKARINHYYSRTHDYAFSTKRDRLMKCHGWTRKQAEEVLCRYLEVTNQVKDYAVKKYVHRLKVNMLQR